ncbi:MAG TPA: hypothetical protein VJU16_08820 [Planctomycetota bacterium]|nr:hypothetical protein [Planctomycetota bacterium]
MSDDALQLVDLPLSEVLRSPLITSLSESPTHQRIEDRLYVEFRQSGISLLVHEDERVGTIHLYGKSIDVYSPYKLKLPLGIRFTESRQLIRDRLGQPVASGGSIVIEIGGLLPAWDLYETPGAAVNIQYSTLEDSVDLVTIMRPADVPRAM